LFSSLGALLRLQQGCAPENTSSSFLADFDLEYHEYFPACSNCCVFKKINLISDKNPFIMTTTTTEIPQTMRAATIVGVENPIEISEKKLTDTLKSSMHLLKSSVMSKFPKFRITESSSALKHRHYAQVT